MEKRKKKGEIIDTLTHLYLILAVSLFDLFNPKVRHKEEACEKIKMCVKIILQKNCTNITSSIMSTCVSVT